jgi:hypothetical protein
MSDAATTAPKEFTQFCAAFGEPATVRREIEDFWANGGSPFPDKVYEHLVQNRMANGGISRERGQFLIDYFRESFAPEPVTGYIPKHREPLITAFANAYASTQKHSLIFRVEADIMNLGGLNEAIKTAMGQGREVEARELANSVIRVMTNILRKKLEPLAPPGHVCPIRSGGDELSIYVNPWHTFDESELKAAIAEAESEMAEFIRTAGLRDIVHLKKGKNPGVGMGCSVANLVDTNGTLQSEIQLRQKLERGISLAKDGFQEKLGPQRQDPKSIVRASVVKDDSERESFKTAQPKTNYIPSIAQIESAFNPSAYSEYLTPAEASPSLLQDDSEFNGENPEDARLQRAKRAMNSLPKGHESAVELKLLEDTIDLTRKIDAVTDLPLFGSIEHSIIPNFRVQCGDKARLIHIDFNNMGGGNKLGPWVGDAMAKVFAQCITEAMKEKKLHKYLPYLTSQGGGKFTLLLPEKVGDRLLPEQLTTAIEKKLVARSQEKLLRRIPEEEINAAATEEEKSALHLQQEKFEASVALIQEEGLKELKKRVNSTSGEQQKMRPILINPDFITINDINNTKSRRQGSHVVTLSKTINLATTSVMATVEQLEAKTRIGQNKSIEDFDQRKVERDKVRDSKEGAYKRFRRINTSANNQNEDSQSKQSFTARVGKKLDKKSFAGTIKVSDPADKSPTR